MIIGIDIGVQGAIAIFDQSGALVEIYDMPMLKDGPVGRRAVNAPLLASIIFKSHADHAYVESVNARPGEGAVGGFEFGRARGVIEGVLAAAGIPADASRAEAIRRWPNHAALFARVKDDGRAEAALIAVAGLLRERTP